VNKELIAELVAALSDCIDVLDSLCDDEINEEFLPAIRAVLAKAKVAQ
jgi:hypothetical protein